MVCSQQRHGEISRLGPVSRFGGLRAVSWRGGGSFCGWLTRESRFATRVGTRTVVSPPGPPTRCLRQVSLSRTPFVTSRGSG